jgi:predicted Zn finger-like uncharacterized protein
VTPPAACFWSALPIPRFIFYDDPSAPIGRLDEKVGFSMAIYIFCPACKGSFKVRDEYAGKQGVCPKCGNVIRIANATSETQRGVPRPATGAQKEEASRLGIDYDERITYVDLRKKIEAAQASKPEGDREALE